MTSCVSSSRPKYPTETTEEESMVEDDAELTLSRAEDEAVVGSLIYWML